MSIPRGVTVRKMSDPKRTPDPNNVLVIASTKDDVEEAKAIIAKALGLSIDSQIAKTHLSWPERWRRISPWSRLIEIGNWINAECYEAMDLVEGPEVSTRGD